MNTQQIKSFILFTLIVVVAFYVANSLSREAEPFATTDSEDISTNFLSIIETLNAIDINEREIQAIINNNVIQTPDVTIVAPQGVGKENPFSSRSGPIRGTSPLSVVPISPPLSGLTPADAFLPTFDINQQNEFGVPISDTPSDETQSPKTVPPEPTSFDDSDTVTETNPQQPVTFTR